MSFTCFTNKNVTAFGEQFGVAYTPLWVNNQACCLACRCDNEKSTVLRNSILTDGTPQ